MTVRRSKWNTMACVIIAPATARGWIHWRTSARRGELMVKEFEQQNEQDLAILIDPWLPRTKASPEQREALEQAISFAATLCLETCRHQGRRLVLGWTGPAPGVRQGPASVKLLHELLEQLAMMRPASEGGLAELFDVMPPAVLREALMVIISTPAPQPDRGSRTFVAALRRSARSLLGACSCSTAHRETSIPLFQLADASTRNILQHRLKHASRGAAIEPGATPPRRGVRRRSSQRRPARSTPDDGRAALMNSYLVYRASFYLMLVVASLALIGDSAEGQFAKLYTVAVTVGGIVAFFTVDLHRRWALPRPLANAPGRRDLGLAVLRIQGRRHPDDSGAGSLVDLPATGQVLPAQDGRGRLVPLPAGIDAGLDRLGRQSERPGRHLALPVGDAGGLGPRPVFLAARGSPTLAGARVGGRESYLRRPLVDPYHGLFDVPYVAGDGPRPGDDPGPGRTDLSGAAAAGGRDPIRPAPRWPAT